MISFGRRETYRFGRLAAFLPFADLRTVEQIGECEPLLAADFALVQLAGFVANQIEVVRFIRDLSGSERGREISWN